MLTKKCKHLHKLTVNNPEQGSISVHSTETSDTVNATELNICLGCGAWRIADTEDWGPWISPLKRNKE